MRLRIRLVLQRVSCVEICRADLQQTRVLDSIESDTMAAVQEGKVTLVLLSLNSQFCMFYTDKIHMNFELLFEVCFTEDGMNFLLSEHTGAKRRWPLSGGREEGCDKSGNLTEFNSLQSSPTSHHFRSFFLICAFSASKNCSVCCQCTAMFSSKRIW